MSSLISEKSSERSSVNSAEYQKEKSPENGCSDWQGKTAESVPRSRA